MAKTPELEKIRRRYAGEDNKVRMPSLDFDSFYLPSASTVVQRLGISAKPEKLLVNAFEEFGVRRPASPSSMRNLTRDGVSVRTFALLSDALRNLLSQISALVSFSDLRRSIQATKLRSNSNGWLAGIKGFRLGAGNCATEYSMVLEFLKNRSDEDIEWRIKARKKLTPDSEMSAIWQVQKELWHGQSLVPRPVLDSFSSVISEYSSFEAIQQNEEAWDTYFIAVLYQVYDFYLFMIAYYDVGNLFFNLDGDSERIHSNRGNSILCQMLESVSSASSSNYMGSYLEVLQAYLREADVGSGYKKLASCISMPKKQGDSVIELKDSQYNALKRWRKEKDLPSIDSFTRFISNYLEMMGKGGEQNLTDIYRIVKALKSLDDECMCNADEGDRMKQLIREILSRYPEYYDAAFQHALRFYKIA